MPGMAQDSKGVLYMSAKRVQAVISGEVQGVGFRYFAAHVASRLDVVGTVRNLPTGDVEAVAEADEEILNLFLDALRQGPSASRVEDVILAWSEPSGEFGAFQAVA
jgi:acylphosphatase